MYFGAIEGIFIPFFGTALGAACVFFMKKSFSRSPERLLTGTAAGVMAAASVWSLIIPAVGLCEDSMGQWAFLPAAAGFMAGIISLMLLDRFIERLGAGGRFSADSTLMLIAVTLHNIPEGMAVGAVYAGLLYGRDDVNEAAAAALAVGIAIQNFPEGAIISLPLRAGGMSRTKSFLYGAASGAVEPIGAAVTIAAAALIIPAMPYLLSFAAGAMIYVTVADMIPGIAADGHSVGAALSFSVGFVIMMSLDVALG